jgi:hypothetical protein
VKDEDDPISAYEPDLQRAWRKAAGLPARYPRIGYEEVVELVNAAWPPTVFMREHIKTTDIVIRFAGSSRQLTDAHRKIYFENFVPLRRVFDDAISKASAKRENTSRWKLATEAHRAYQMTWLRLFRVQFLNQVYPEINPPKWFSDMEKIFNSRRPPGRPKKDNDDQLRSKRFNLLLDRAERLHQIIGDHLAKKPAENRSDRVEVLRTFWRQILKVPGGISILGGEAFNKIPYGKQDEPAKLEDPTTWKPRQLAMALLAFEVGQAYHTVERKLATMKKKRSI